MKVGHILDPWDLDAEKPQHNFRKHYQALVKWFGSLVVKIMNWATYTRLIELKRKHEHVNELVTFIAQRKDYWKWWEVERKRGMETPLTLAMKAELDPLVITILNEFPEAAMQVDKEGRNIFHLAAEKRQVEIFKLLTSNEPQRQALRRYLLSEFDFHGNTILHYAAKPVHRNSSPMQMCQEFKWFEQVKFQLPRDLINHRNSEGKTAQEVFSESHQDMVESGKDQLTNIARTCSAALVNVVAFAAGFSFANDRGNKDTTNASKNELIALKIYSHAYLIGLSCTSIALIQFMSLLLSSYKENDFRRSLPTQYALSLTTLFLATLSMLVAFGCHIYSTIHGTVEQNWRNSVFFALEIFFVPAICLAIRRYQGINFGIAKIFG